MDRRLSARSPTWRPLGVRRRPLPFEACAGVSARPVSRSPLSPSGRCSGATPSTATRPATTCARSSRRAATSSTRPTATAAETPRPSSATCWTARSRATTSSSAPRRASPGRVASDGSTCRGAGSWPSSTRRCAASAPTTSTSGSRTRGPTTCRSPRRSPRSNGRPSSGRARYVGVSNYSGWQSARAFSLLESARIPLVANEIEYSLVCRTPEHEVAPAATSLGFGLLPWSPLGRGVLTGKYRNGIPSGSRAASSDFPGFAERFLDEQTTRVADAVAMAARGLGAKPGGGCPGVAARPARRGGAHRRRPDGGSAALRAGQSRARPAVGDRGRPGRRLGLTPRPAPDRAR